MMCGIVQSLTVFSLCLSLFHSLMLSPSRFFPSLSVSVCVSLPCSSGSMASGRRWEWTTSCLWRTDTCATSALRPETSSGAACWRRPTPSRLSLSVCLSVCLRLSLPLSLFLSLSLSLFHPLLYLTPLHSDTTNLTLSLLTSCICLSTTTPPSPLQVEGGLPCPGDGPPARGHGRHDGRRDGGGDRGVRLQEAARLPAPPAGEGGPHQLRQLPGRRGPRP